MGSLKGGGSQNIQLVNVLFFKPPNNIRQLPAFSLEVRLIFELLSQQVGDEKRCIFTICTYDVMKAYHGELFSTEIKKPTNVQNIVK